MKIRLRVSTPSRSFDFEHAGPNCTVGRDPAGDLALTGEGTDAVSWKHARIDLAPGGAWLEDHNTSNGTFLRDVRVKGRTALKVGDEVRLGQSGPRLQVMALDGGSIGPPAPGPGWLVPALAAGLAVCLLAVLLLGVLLWRQSSQAAAEMRDLTKQLSELSEKSRELERQQGDLNRRSDELARKMESRPDRVQEQISRDLAELTRNLKTMLHLPAAAAPPPPPPPPKEGDKPKEVPAARLVRTALGKLDALPRAGTALVAHRQAGAKEWRRLSAGDRVHSADTLVCLPGYRGEVRLDSGVRLGLWGDMEGLYERLAVLESRVVLHEPPAGVDLDLTLQRGRLVLANDREKGPALVRIRYRGHTWDVKLPDRTSAAAIDLRCRAVPGLRREAEPPLPVARLVFLMHGKAALDKVWKELPAFPNADRLACLLLPDGAGGIKELWPQLPGWWEGKEATPPGQAAAPLASLAGHLEKTAGTVDEGLAGAVRSKDVSLPGQALATFALAALDDLPALLDLLQDDKQPALSEAALLALCNWLGVEREHERAVVAGLKAREGKGGPQAAVLLPLLCGWGESDLARKETFTDLGKRLDDESLAVRQMAHLELLRLFPDAQGKLPYDPAAPPPRRAPAVKKWQEFLRETR